MSVHESVEATGCVAEDWTSALATVGDRDLGGYLNWSVDGDATWAGTISLERRFGTTDGWKTVNQWTASDAKRWDLQGTRVDIEPGVEYRLGIHAGDWTTGSVDLRLSR